MRHPYEKIIRIELLAVACVILIGVFALFQGILLLVFLSFYLLALSLVCDALVDWYGGDTLKAGKQVLRAVMILLFTTFLLFHL
ncbi:hypothetical protein [Lentibacillus sediminis]|uniref:hypothetical protein n=1 Tax=Lentibacillus sediminis TaxID=1940529 RepID=UPI000C1C0EF8|nr:hypothetical protein [Lentibacillus sediminis]